MKPEDWQPGTLDAIATGSADGRRIVVKAVNYAGQPNTLLVRLQGSGVPEEAAESVHTGSAGLTDAPSLEAPDRIAPITRAMPYARDLAVELDPYTVAVVEIAAR